MPTFCFFLQVLSKYLDTLVSKIEAPGPHIAYVLAGTVLETKGSKLLVVKFYDNIIGDLYFLICTFIF